MLGNMSNSAIPVALAVPTFSTMMEYDAVPPGPLADEFAILLMIKLGAAATVDIALAVTPGGTWSLDNLAVLMTKSPLAVLVLISISIVPPMPGAKLLKTGNVTVLRTGLALVQLLPAAVTGGLTVGVPIGPLTIAVISDALAAV